MCELFLDQMILSRMSCFQLCFKQICEQTKKNYTTIFLNSWTIPNNLIFFDSKFSEEQLSPLNRISKYTGFSVNIIPISDQINLKEIDILLKKYKIAILQIDYFFCSWHEFFLKEHFNKHCCIIKGLDDKKIICEDPFTNTKEAKLKYEDFKLGAKSIYCFDLIDQEETLLNFDIIINNSLEMIKKNNTFCRINEIANYFIAANSKKCIFNDSNVYSCDIVILLKNISNSRYQFHYLIKQVDANSKYAYKFLEISNEWNKVCQLLMKLCFSNEKYFEKIKNCIVKMVLTIRDKEYLIYKEFLNISQEIKKNGL